MNNRRKFYLTLIFAIMAVYTTMAADENDPYQWLEEVENEKALEWVNDWNEKSVSVLSQHPEYSNIYEKNLEIMNSMDRIASPAIYGDYIFNFWQDAEHQRGIWRRTTYQSYLSNNPKWEILLDMDELSERDNIKWVFKGATGLFPDYKRFMVSLSRGGGDAVEIREFDVESKKFVEGGFYLPEAKGSASWVDENTLLVSTDFGEGVTTSGYPMQVKVLKRGQDLNDAHEIYKGVSEDMSIRGYAFHTPKKTYQIVSRMRSFYEGDYYFREGGELIKPDLPSDIQMSTIFKDQVVFELKSDWSINGTDYPRGAVISIPYNDLIKNKISATPIVIPDERSSVSQISFTKDRLLINMLVNVKSELYSFRFDKNWKKERINAPDLGTISLGTSDIFSNRYFYTFQNFLNPSTLYAADASTNKSEAVKSLPSWFDTEKYTVQQLETESSDGTRIPYFVVHARDMQYDGTNPTLLYAYGGFEIPMLPGFSALTGTAWLEKGGVYVLANIRGGGEFGPKWHQAGLKENRQIVYDDFHSVAGDLIARKITRPEKLGIYGGSNGGLLVGVAFTQRPDLYEAVVCAVPLLDMQRYNKLLAGASWMAEYGNPDIPEEWEYIRQYSPYHNLKAGKDYPEVFFTTSTRDDRVHPGHARKMVAKMHDLGYKIYYFENTEGGHAGASTNEQRATMYAQIYTYLNMKLMPDTTGKQF